MVNFQRSPGDFQFWRFLKMTAEKRERAYSQSNLQVDSYLMLNRVFFLQVCRPKIQCWSCTLLPLCDTSQKTCLQTVQSGWQKVSYRIIQANTMLRYYRTNPVYTEHPVIAAVGLTPNSYISLKHTIVFATFSPSTLKRSNTLENATTVTGNATNRRACDVNDVSVFESLRFRCPH